ncbi:hypothetical protein [Neobacillus terrae]|uniref:hypothetical protein n=1 Tax=Neobacillus terrae TaxID=3034837 RepID=UPI00140B8967|nr:hypothetical protein [Neobacillus terrae]NHM31828.1 hypothetical protein [Neobacillus terrae]
MVRLEAGEYEESGCAFIDKEWGDSLAEIVHSLMESVHSLVESVHSLMEIVHSRVESVHSRVESVHSLMEIVHSLMEIVHLSKLRRVFNREIAGMEDNKSL